LNGILPFTGDGAAIASVFLGGAKYKCSTPLKSRISPLIKIPLRSFRDLVELTIPGAGVYFSQIEKPKFRPFSDVRAWKATQFLDQTVEKSALN
jgi:hypothetical protein